MKRYFFGLLAIVAAIGAAAFTTPKVATNKLADSYFEFDYAHYSPTVANVEDESKWINVTDLGTCNNSAVKACRIEVASTYVSGSTLLSTAAIQATTSSPNVAYVTSGNIVTIRNKN
ncbi:hypothetical protein QWZ08_00400 [Ferruginibacter paludis]|uniref:hypothetical protein n=1 Tax=Ferruginibacter paludis TaxID=1310417 RepID=UPI0025B51AB6|nr:hypothetical protein [Ferruginibacter paludis]MDN3654061.1 hypothetical protein [Ferruginibacter paludis]